ncbi:MAG: prepilin-type N-terminal cleavage/methylation domain-containing protein [Planctomycetota bacterium]
MTHRPARHALPACLAPAFTLVEMIVVISIIAIAAAITFPFVGAMTRDLNATNGVNTVQAATTAARAYATRDKATTVLDATLGITADYSGSAALFTPDNLIRIVENAGSGVGDARSLTNATGEFLESVYDVSPDFIVLNGFTDVLGREPIQLDPATGVVGIVRAPDDATHNAVYPVRLTNSDTTRLIPPPFAVWFSPSGSIVAGIPLLTGAPSEVDRSRNRVLYYDGDHTRDRGVANHIDVDRLGVGNWNSSRRTTPGIGPATYDVDLFDPSSSQYAAATAFDTNLNRAILPFEEIETVVGVIVYDKSAFRAAGFDWPADATTGLEIAEWITENGTAVFFSPTSGVAFRETSAQ